MPDGYSNITWEQNMPILNGTEPCQSKKNQAMQETETKKSQKAFEVLAYFHFEYNTKGTSRSKKEYYKKLKYIINHT